VQVSKVKIEKHEILHHFVAVNDNIISFLYIFRTMDPVFISLSASYPDVKFIIINLEMFTGEAAELGVTMVPTFKFVSEREVVCTVFSAPSMTLK
jgi:hypothetical protein